MALSSTGDYQTALNEILWAWERNWGVIFPYDEIVRDGAISDADARTLRTAYLSYRTTRMARPNLTPAHPDAASQIDQTNLLGKSSKGGTSPQEDTSIHSDVSAGKGK